MESHKELKQVVIVKEEQRIQQCMDYLNDFSVHFTTYGKYEKALDAFIKVTDSGVSFQKLPKDCFGIFGQFIHLVPAAYKNKYLDWLNKGAAQEQAVAQYQLAELYARRRLTDSDEGQDRALFWYEKAAHNGHADAQYKVAEKYAALSKTTEIIGHIPLSENEVQEKVRRCVRMVRISKFEIRKEKLDPEEVRKETKPVYETKIDKEKAKRALDLYQNAAIQDHEEAQCALARLYDQGDCIDRNPIIATKWAKLAARAYDFTATEMLVKKYREGNGAPKNEILAIQRIYQGAIFSKSDCFIHFLNEANKEFKLPFSYSQAYFIFHAGAIVAKYKQEMIESKTQERASLRRKASSSTSLPPSFMFAIERAYRYSSISDGPRSNILSGYNLLGQTYPALFRSMLSQQSLAEQSNLLSLLDGDNKIMILIMDYAEVSTLLPMEKLSNCINITEEALYFLQEMPESSGARCYQRLLPIINSCKELLLKPLSDTDIYTPALDILHSAINTEKINFASTSSSSLYSSASPMVGILNGVLTNSSTDTRGCTNGMVNVM